MKKLPLKTQTVNLETGEVTEGVTQAMILPPRDGACGVCGRYPAHELNQPHDAQQLYYQYSFYGTHGRWPTWRDAAAHCSDEVRQAWETALRKRGLWPEP